MLDFLKEILTKKEIQELREILDFSLEPKIEIEQLQEKIAFANFFHSKLTKLIYKLRLIHVDLEVTFENWYAIEIHNVALSYDGFPELLKTHKDYEREIKKFPEYAEYKKLLDNAKEEKRAALEKFFAENAEETAEVLTFEKIFNQKWLNATYSLDTAEADIISAIKKARTDLDLIRKTGGKYTAAMIEDYAQYRDMTSAMNKKLILEMREKLEEERKEKNEAAARAIEEEKRKREELHAQLENTQDPQPAATPAEETMEVIDFRVWVTPEQKMKLRDFIVTNKIKYGRVPK